MPIVSIIIATYNSGKTIRCALDSVKSQSYQDWECVVVDGASKDDTMEIVREFAVNDSRFRYVSEPDHGIYDAFNKGWKMAAGEWVHYLGSDDRLTKEGLGQLLTTSCLDDYEIVSGNCYIEKIDGTIKENISKGFGGCHQGKLTRKSTMERFCGFDESFSIMADDELMWRMKRAGVKIKNVEAFVAYFSMAGTSQSFGGLIKRCIEKYRIYKINHVPRPLFEICAYFSKKMLSSVYWNIRKIIK